MKRIELLLPLLLSLFIQFNCVYAQNEVWKRKQPTPQEHPLFCVRQIPGTQTVVTAGSGSTIMYSDDEGDNWDITHNQAGLPNETQFLSVAFYNEQIGYAAANYGKIIRTADGGETWELVYDGASDTLNTERADIYLIDSETVIIVGFNSLILKTEDSGSNWNTIVCPDGFHPYSIDFVNQDTGYIVGFGDSTIILKTVDMGSNWEIQDFDSEFNAYCYDIYFINDTEGIISANKYGTGDSICIFKTGDAGNSWQLIYKLAERDACGEIDFKNETHGAIRIFSWVHSFLYTEDGGETWTPDNNPVFYNYSPCYSFSYNSDYLIAVGRFGVIGRLYTNSETWEILTDNYYSDKCLKALFTSSLIGYTQYTARTGGIATCCIFKTSDGGNNWDPIFHAISDGGFSFYDDNNGFILDCFYEGGILYKTSDGGETWNDIYTFGEIPFNWDEPKLVSFYDSMNGIISYNGIIFKTEDGGYSWQNIFDIGDDNDIFSSVQYVSVDTIFFANFLNQKPVIVKTFNSGSSFIIDTIDLVNYYPNKIYFTENTGFLLLYNKYEIVEPVICKSINGGESWYPTIINDTCTSTYKNIFFATANIGYAVGSGNYTTMLKTVDGGESWDPIEIPCTSGLSHVYFHDKWHGLVFGDNGIIFETLTGGVVGKDDNTFVANKPVYTISPNPSASIIHIDLYEQAKNDLLIEFFSIRGERISNNMIPVIKNHNKVSFNVSSLLPGIYIARIKNGNIMSTSRFVKL